MSLWLRRSLAIAILALAPVASALAAHGNPSRAGRDGAARLGARWLARAVPAGSDGQSADTAAALRATGQLDPTTRAARITALRAGATRYAKTPGAAAKVALGLVALGAERPRCAGSIDLVARMNAGVRHGHYGRTIFDQTLAMLATRALGRPVSSAPIRWLRGARHGGGWSVLAGQPADVSSTAMAVLALRAAKVPANDPMIVSAMRWIGGKRSSSGGFALGRTDRTESNSTALAIEAATSVGRRDPRAAAALRGLQRADGSFNFTATDAGSRTIASTDAVVALAGRTIPVAWLARPAPACSETSVSYRLSGR
jgi:hypothetical protein